MKSILFLCVALAACTNGPSVSTRWQTTDKWGDGNCNQDFTWYDEVDVAVSDAAGPIASETYHCDAGGFDIAVPDGATNVAVDVTVVIHQDATHPTAPMHFEVPGPVHGDVDLGRITFP